MTPFGRNFYPDPSGKGCYGSYESFGVGRAYGLGPEFKGRQVAFQSYVVQPDFLRVMGIPLPTDAISWRATSTRNSER